MVQILAVEQNSPCRNRVHPGDFLVAIDGHPMTDVIDYMFYSALPRLTLTVKDAAGHYRMMRVKKEQYEELGFTFENFLMDHLRSCKNNCMFCFIDQLPKGMRDTLYFKDDDSRMSFLRGNYITLTNLSERDIDRMIAMKISPINVSVHTTDPDLRVRMMRNPTAGKCYELLRRFTAAGITVNCQIVLCRGVNDGSRLDQTMADLTALYPGVGSIAVVPAGLTRYRAGLYPLENFTKEEARQVLEQINASGDVNEQKTGLRLVYPGDEWFLKAELPIPEEAYYGEFSQLENGVGMMSLLRGQFADALEELAPSEKARHIVLATGVAAHPFLRGFVDETRKKWHNLECTVLEVENDFFGHDITVAGLVTGRDLREKLDGAFRAAERPFEEILIPDTMLRFENDRFLDDVTLTELASRYGCAITAVKNDGQALLCALTGSGEPTERN